MRDVPRESMRNGIMIRRSNGKEKRRLSVLLLLVSGLLAGCGFKQEPVEITLIHGFGTSEDTHVAMRQIYQDFEKEHPDIKLHMISMPSSEDVVEKVENMLAVGKVPDVIFTAGEGKDSIYEYMVSHDKAVDLMPYMEADEAFYENVSPVVFDTWETEQGELYTVSDVHFMVGYWYNRSLFEQAGIRQLPKNWEEFEKVCQQLKRIDGEKQPMMLDGEHMVYLLNLILHEENGYDLEKVRKNFMELQTPGGQEALEQLKKIVQSADTLEAYSFRDALDAFNKEETAIYINGVWGSGLIDQGLDVGYAPFPSGNGESVSMVSACIGYLLGNTKDEKRTEASVEFLKYMLSEPVAYRILEETGQLPSNPKVEVSEKISDRRLYDAVESMKAADRFVEVPANLWSRKLMTAYGKNLMMYMDNKISIEEMHKNLEGLF